MIQSHLLHPESFSGVAARVARNVLFNVATGVVCGLDIKKYALITTLASTASILLFNLIVTGMGFRREDLKNRINVTIGLAIPIAAIEIVALRHYEVIADLGTVVLGCIACANVISLNSVVESHQREHQPRSP